MWEEIVIKNFPLYLYFRLLYFISIYCQILWKRAFSFENKYEYNYTLQLFNNIIIIVIIITKDLHIFFLFHLKTRCIVVEFERVTIRWNKITTKDIFVVRSDAMISYCNGSTYGLNTFIIIVLCNILNK